MRSGIFLTLCVMGYIAFIVWNVYKLKDIARNPQKYETVKGKERYRRSFWYESQPLLLTLDEGYLLTATPSDLERGITPVGPPAPR